MSCYCDQKFIECVDEAIVAYLSFVQPSRDLFVTLHNLHMIAHQIVNEGGFPDGTRMRFHFDSDDKEVDEIHFQFKRKGVKARRHMAFFLGGARYARPACFGRLVREMQQMAIALREADCPCN